MTVQRTFCTLFDKNYLFRGLTMYYSLVRHNPNAVLHILCMDEETKVLLTKLNLKQAQLISLNAFETQALKAVKPERTIAEYCWTLGSSLLWHVLEKAAPDEVVGYLDSDLFFFSSLDPVYQELGDKSVWIVRHNYESKFQYLESRSGIYNVALVLARNNADGQRCIGEWRQQCLDWCFNRYEDGKFGDQKYLDVWPQKYLGVVVSAQLGADVAPWNINRYTVVKRGERVYVNDFSLIFYHFHSLKMYSVDDFQLFHPSYKISKIIEKYIYEPYLFALKETVQKAQAVDLRFNFGFTVKPTRIQKIKDWLKNIVIFFYFARVKK